MRNLAIIIALATIPILIMSVFYYKSTTKSIGEEISSANDNYLKSVAAIVDATVHSSEIFAIQTSINDSVINLAFTSLEDNSILKIQGEVMNYIKNYIYIYDYIHSAYIYTEKSNLVIENQVIMDLEDHEDKGWYEYYSKTPVKKSAIISRDWRGKYPSIVTIIRPIGDEYGKIGCVVVNLDISSIIKNSRAVVETRDDIIVITDSQNKVVFSEQEKWELSASDIKNIVKADKTKIAGSEYLVSRKNSEFYDWNYIMLFSNEYYSQFAKEQFGYSMVIIIALILAVIICSFIMSLHSYQPIRKILGTIDTSEEVNRIETANTEGDEISYIVKMFKEKESLKEELEAELKYRMLLLNKAQTYALQAQINPHFLNNVMETINWLSIDLLGEKNKISDIIKPLSVLFSIGADTESYLVSVEEELRHVNIYTYISSVIYGDKINFSWNINPDIMQYKTLKFTLQPLIENAITHGIKPKRRKGTISIEGDFHNESIRFVIKDDGVGIKQNVLEEINNELQDENIHKKSHLGINNVNQRLKLVFGQQCSLKVYNSDDSGAVVEIYIPKVTQKSPEFNES